MTPDKRSLPQAVNTKTIRDALLKCKDQIGMALPKHLTADRLVRVVLTAMQTQPKLMECTQHSLFAAIFECAQLGLMPDGVLGHAWLIPYEDRKRGVMEAQFQLGYKGIMELAYRADRGMVITPRVVCENDTYEIEYGLNEKLVHVPAKENRGELVAVYAIARWADGRTAWRWMWKEDVDRHRAISKAPNSPAWCKYYPAMAMKTVLIQLCKYLPQSTELTRAVALDEMADAGIPQRLDLQADLGNIVDPIAEASKVKQERIADGQTEPEPEDAETQELLWQTWKLYSARAYEGEPPKGWQAKAAAALKAFRKQNPTLTAVEIIQQLQDGQIL